MRATVDVLYINGARDSWVIEGTPEDIQMRVDVLELTQNLHTAGVPVLSVSVTPILEHMDWYVAFVAGAWFFLLGALIFLLITR